MSCQWEDVHVENNYSAKVKQTNLLLASSLANCLLNKLTLFKKWAHHRPLFVYFRSFQIQLHRKIVDFSGIRIRIVGVEGGHADHLTTNCLFNLLKMFDRLWSGSKRGTWPSLSTPLYWARASSSQGSHPGMTRPEISSKMFLNLWWGTNLVAKQDFICWCKVVQRLFWDFRTLTR